MSDVLKRQGRFYGGAWASTRKMCASPRRTGFRSLSRARTGAESWLYYISRLAHNLGRLGIDTGQAGVFPYCPDPRPRGLCTTTRTGILSYVTDEYAGT